MGLERITAVLQGVTSNYDTDLLRVLVDRAAQISGKVYTGGPGRDDVSMRVIADHARTTAFLMAEGVLPDRSKREYVLRRVMRRAIHHGQRLGIEKPFLHEVALQVVDSMSGVYPELRDRRELIARVTEDEEIRFRQTLKRGMKILEERIEDLRSTSTTTLPPAQAADLYSTYGFPLDLTAVIGREHGIEVDVDAADRIVKSAEATDGPIDAASKVDTAYHEARAKLAAPVGFTGYDREEGESQVVAIVKITSAEGEKKQRSLVDRAQAGEAVEIVVASTPFYGESGGQVGDSGLILAEGLRLEVADTQKPYPGLVTHEGVVKEGSISVGEKVRLVVDHAARTATRRNHSATHVLHWALRSVLGEHAQQKGSRVGPDVLRFDFTHNKALTREEITRIEDLANAKILTNAPVVTEVLSMDEAKKRGAMAIFEEKYGDTVRMLTMTGEVVELCGGTHARALGDIGLFKIVSEGGVAAGVRRIFATTGLNALAHVREAESELNRARQAAKAQGGDLVEKINKMTAHERELEKEVSDLKRQLLEGGGGSGGAGGGIDSMLAGAQEFAGVKVLAHRVADGTDAGALRELCDKLRDKLGASSAVLLASVTDGKAQLAVMISKAATEKIKAGDLIKVIAGVVGGRGGGRPDMAQAGGPDVAKIDEAVAATYAEAARILGVS